MLNCLSVVTNLAFNIFASLNIVYIVTMCVITKIHTPYVLCIEVNKKHVWHPFSRHNWRYVWYW